MSDKMVAPRPAIARIWRGRTRPEHADTYEAYNYDVGIKPLIEKALGVQTLREDRRDETEFWTISYWESIAAMSRFTGDDPARIHHLPRDTDFLIELPSRVQILKIAPHTAIPAVTPPDAARSHGCDLTVPGVEPNVAAHAAPPRVTAVAVILSVPMSGR